MIKCKKDLIFLSINILEVNILGMKMKNIILIIEIILNIRLKR